MTNNISIPKPCQEDWNNMPPEQQGRHCMACCKTVIDFTNWEGYEILHYLETRSNEKVCGRFNASQLGKGSEPENIFPIILKSNISFLKKIAAIVLLCFGVMTSQSCAQQTKGEVSYAPDKLTEDTVLMGAPLTAPSDSLNQRPLNVDTTKYEPQIMGMIKPPPKKVKVPKKPLPGGTK